MSKVVHYITGRYLPKKQIEASSAEVLLPDAAPPVVAEPLVRVKTLAEFFNEYAPFTYIVEPFVRSSSLYTLTAKTGAGKSAFLLTLALAVATGRGELIGTTVQQGRVGYCAFENPDDLRARLMVAAWVYNIDVDGLADSFVIIDRRAKPEEIAKALQGKFALIICDTLQAAFDGDALNSNTQGRDFMRRERLLTQLLGNPAVVIACHPRKGAGDGELIPYGAGAILNEVDGNLTLRKLTHGHVELHWQGKFRGVEFEPILLRLEMLGSPRVRDNKGRQVQLPAIRPSNPDDVEACEKASTNRDVALLRSVAENPAGTIRAWAAAAGISRSAVDRRLKTLASPAKGKLVARTLDKWELTGAGRKALEVHSETAKILFH
jgi:hypothetical protein